MTHTWTRTQQRFRKLFTVGAVAAVALLGVTACSSPEPSTDTVEEEPTDAALSQEVAAGYIETLSLGFPDCDWTPADSSSSETAIVYMTSCTSDELILATSDQSAVKVWAEDMATNTDLNGYVIRGDDYALFALDKGNLALARDLLGGDGEVVDLS
ncbi:hypothetical protein [Cryobacterium sp. Y62]|uniref:hypothetical protein n=1 Tax=Cryobacterium sp. Y62 TaxID=2048284 RepID=UPI000CE4310E|nr:hypothetical protein [Cryobacterium sp. Y62]